jgi:hypothetical protein
MLWRIVKRNRNPALEVQSFSRRLLLMVLAADTLSLNSLIYCLYNRSNQGSAFAIILII